MRPDGWAQLNAVWWGMVVPAITVLICSSIILFVILEMVFGLHVHWAR